MFKRLFGKRNVKQPESKARLDFLMRVLDKSIAKPEPNAKLDAAIAVSLVHRSVIQWLERFGCLVQPCLELRDFTFVPASHFDHRPPDCLG